MYHQVCLSVFSALSLSLSLPFSLSFSLFLSSFFLHISLLSFLTSVCRSVCLCLFLSVSLSLSPLSFSISPFFLHFFLSVCLPLSLSVCLFLSLSLSASFLFLSFCLTVYLSAITLHFLLIIISAVEKERGQFRHAVGKDGHSRPASPTSAGRPGPINFAVGNFLPVYETFVLPIVRQVFRENDFILFDRLLDFANYRDAFKSIFIEYNCYTLVKLRKKA